jgi:hypothetical protein
VAAAFAALAALLGLLLRESTERRESWAIP